MAIDWNAVVVGPALSVFGEPVIYYPSGSAAYSITGVYDSPYQKETLLPDGSTGVTTVVPTLGVQLSQFTNPPKQGDRLWVLSVNTTYQVREVRVDSHGAARLMLNKVSSP